MTITNRMERLITADTDCTCADTAGLDRRNRAATARYGSRFAIGFYVTQAELGATPHTCETN